MFPTFRTVRVIMQRIAVLISKTGQPIVEKLVETGFSFSPVRDSALREQKYNMNKCCNALRVHFLSHCSGSASFCQCGIL